jgi:hypothetical protein
MGGGAGYFSGSQVTVRLAEANCSQ